MTPDQRIAKVAARQYGVVCFAQAARAGLSRHDVAYRTRTGRWQRIYRTVYLIGGAPLTFEGDVLAATLAVGAGAYGSHRTSARLFALFAEALPPEVTVEGRRRVRIGSIVVHRPVSLARSDVTQIGPIPVTTPLRTIIDLASCLSKTETEAVLDEAVRRGLVRVDALASRIGSLHHVPGIGTLRELVAERADGAFESLMEVRFEQLLRNAGLPIPKRQHVIVDADGFIGRVDFAYVDRKIAIEIDSYAYHSGRGRFDADHERDLRLDAAGWLPVRIAAKHVRTRPKMVVDRVRRALEQRNQGQ